jgi:putative flippase GtrA
LLARTRSWLGREKVAYLIVGGLNTIFGYVCSALLYYSLYDVLHIVVIGVVASVISITFSFTTYKLLVFRTKGGWLREYGRCYVVYGLSSALSITAMWILVDLAGVPFWLAQALVTCVVVVISYVGHSRFTFSRARMARRDP